jgi:hypothetical protein
MSRLNEFRNMVDGIEDKEVLESGRDLIRDMMEISKLEEKIKELKSGLAGDVLFLRYGLNRGRDCLRCRKNCRKNKAD